MKILITAPSLDEAANVSGISTVVRQIVTRGTNSYVHFAAGRRDGERRNLEWLTRQLYLSRRLRETIRREKIELVHLNTALNPLSIVRDYALTGAVKKENIPLVLHLHGGKFLAEEFTNSILKNLCEKMLRRADLILVLSELEKQNISKCWQNLRVEVLPNAVAVEDFSEVKTENEIKTLIYLGRLDSAKGLNEIIAACRRLKKANFKFYFRAFGAGASKDFFIAEMQKILGADFYFGGVISGAEKKAELNRADIFVLPSYFEGLPLALLEAMAAGCVPIVSGLADGDAIIENGKNGFLIETKNVEQLTDKLKLLLGNQSNLAVLRHHARRTIAEKFNLKDYIQNLEAIYQSTAEKK